jgi:hypothetical protein
MVGPSLQVVDIGEISDEFANDVGKNRSSLVAKD